MRAELAPGSALRLTAGRLEAACELARAALLVGALGMSQHTYAQATDAAALQSLQQFLGDPAARKAFAVGRPDAQQANTFFEKFPPYAQTEIMNIVVAVIQETQGRPTLPQGDIHGAYAAFSPAVKARISALQARLLKDPAFNSPANLQMMKRFFPAFLGVPSS